MNRILFESKLDARLRTAWKPLVPGQVYLNLFAGRWLVAVSLGGLALFGLAFVVVLLSHWLAVILATPLPTRAAMQGVLALHAVAAGAAASFLLFSCYPPRRSHARNGLPAPTYQPDYRAFAPHEERTAVSKWTFGITAFATIVVSLVGFTLALRTGHNLTSALTWASAGGAAALTGMATSLLLLTATRRWLIPFAFVFVAHVLVLIPIAVVLENPSLHATLFRVIEPWLPPAWIIGSEGITLPADPMRLLILAFLATSLPWSLRSLARFWTSRNNPEEEESTATINSVSGLGRAMRTSPLDSLPAPRFIERLVLGALPHDILHKIGIPGLLRGEINLTKSFLKSLGLGALVFLLASSWQPASVGGQLLERMVLSALAVWALILAFAPLLFAFNSLGLLRPVEIGTHRSAYAPGLFPLRLEESVRAVIRQSALLIPLCSFTLAIPLAGFAYAASSNPAEFADYLSVATVVAPLSVLCVIVSLLVDSLPKESFHWSSGWTTFCIDASAAIMACCSLFAFALVRHLTEEGTGWLTLFVCVAAAISFVLSLAMFCARRAGTYIKLPSN